MNRLLVLATIAITAGAAEWSAPVEVRHDDKLALTYQAMFDGEHLLVKAAIQPTWHTFVMDNKQRQQEKLAGKPSLGIEKSTEITVSGGLEITGPWLQSAPQDFSKPEIRWFTWGFENQALFAAKAKPAGPGPAQINVKGQACSADICRNIDVTLAVPASPGGKSGVDVKQLTAVRN